MTEISFSRLAITDRRVDVHASFEHEIDLYFAFDRAVPVSSSRVALTLAALCGRKFDHISFDFEVAPTTANSIADFTGAELSFWATTDPDSAASRSGQLLSFSGGFDSLSARALMPADTSLVSVGFGGWFEREADFFRKFETLVVTTNARSEPDHQTALARNSHAFMAVGALLTSDYFGAEFHTFGQIMGGSARLRPGPLAMSLMNGAGLKNAPFTVGISEVASASILVRRDPDLIADSLESLAGKNDPKRFRKTVLSQVVAKQNNVALALDHLISGWKRPVDFGSDVATTLVALYCMKQATPAALKPLFTKIPWSARRFAKRANLAFLEKYDPTSYEDFPPSLKDGLLTRFEELGVHPYDDDDFADLERLKNYLAALN